MKTLPKTTAEIKAIVQYIMWNYDENCRSISQCKPDVNVQDLSNTFIVKINYIADVEKAQNSSADPITHKEDKYMTTRSMFALLKNESYRQLTKYVEDICDEMSKINIEV